MEFLEDRQRFSIIQRLYRFDDVIRHNPRAHCIQQIEEKSASLNRIEGLAESSLGFKAVIFSCGLSPQKHFMRIGAFPALGHSSLIVDRPTCNIVK